MSTRVGAVTGVLEGEDRGFSEAVEMVTRMLDKMSESAKANAAKLKELTAASEGTEKASRKMSQSAKANAEKVKQLTDHMDHLDDRATRVQTAISGVASALGFSGTRIADLAGGVADLAMNFASGGLLLTGISLLGVAVAAAYAHFKDLKSGIEEASSALDEYFVKMLDDAKRKADDAAEAVRNFGKSATQAAMDAVKAERSQAEAIESGALRMRQLASQYLTKVRGKNQALAGATAQEILDIVSGVTAAPGLTKGINVAQTKVWAEQYLLAEKRLDGVRNALPEILRREAELAELLKKQNEERKTAAALAAKSFNPNLNYTSDPGTAAGLAILGQTQLRLGMDETPADKVRESASDEAIRRVIANDERVTEKLRQDTFNLSEASKDTARSLENVRTAFDAVTPSLRVFDAALAGRGFEGAGAEVGAMAGGVVGSFFGGAAIGEAIGGALGAVAGGAIDSLVGVLGTLTPLFDAFGVVVKALSPIFIVLKSIFQEFGDLFIMALVPGVHAFAESIAIVLIGALRFLQVVGPFAALIIGGVLNALYGFTEGLAQVLIFVDNVALRPLANGARDVANMLITFQNVLIDWIRATIPGLQEFGIKLEQLDVVGHSSAIADFATSLDEIRAYGEDQVDATEDNTEVMREFTRSLTNIPNGYRIRLTEFRTQPLQEGQLSAGGMGTTINGGMHLNLGNPGVEQQLARSAVRRNGSVTGGANRRRNGGAGSN